MSLILTGLLVVQVLSALTIIALVLLQQGKGADMGSAFGGGSAGSLFGAAGAANFLSRCTKWAAIVFFCATVGLAYVSHGRAPAEAPVGVMEGYEDPSIPVVPGAGDNSVPQAPDASVPAAPAAPQADSVPSAAPVPAPASTPAPEAGAGVAPAATESTPSGNPASPAPDMTAEKPAQQEQAENNPPANANP